MLIGPRTRRPRTRRIDLVVSKFLYQRDNVDDVIFMGTWGITVHRSHGVGP